MAGPTPLAHPALEDGDLRVAKVFKDPVPTRRFEAEALLVDHRRLLTREPGLAEELREVLLELLQSLGGRRGKVVEDVRDVGRAGDVPSLVLFSVAHVYGDDLLPLSIISANSPGVMSGLFIA